MNKLIALVLLTLVYKALPAQQTFQYAIGGQGADAGKSIVKTTDGGFAIGGSYGEDSTDFYLVKLNSAGFTQWSRRIGGSSFDACTAVIQTADGGYALTGRTGYWTFEMYVVKFDSSGNLQWTTRVSNSLFDQGYTIIQTADGGYVISGRTDDQTFNSMAWLVKLNSAGNVVWTKSVSGFLDGAYAVVQTSDKGYVLSGATNTFGAGNLDLYFVKLDSNGNNLWTRTVGGTNDDQVFPATKMIKTTDGGFAIAAFTNSFGAGGNDIYVVKLGSTGNLQWTRVIGGTGDDIGSAIAMTSDKGFIVAGSTNSFGAGNTDAYIVRLDSSGVLLWTRTAGGTGNEAGYGIVQTNGGGYLMTGSTTSFGFGNGDVYIVKLDAAGNSCGNPGVGGLTTTGGVAGSGGGNTGNTNYTTGSGGFVNYNNGLQASICSCNNTASIVPGGPLTFCSGSNVLLQANTGSGYNYSWKRNGVVIPGALNSAYLANTSGTYKVAVTDVNNGCLPVESTGKTVTVKTTPTAVAAAQGPTTFCSGDSVELKTNSNSNYTYQWKRNNSSISGAITNKLNVKTAGTYKVKVTGNNGCTVISNAIVVSVPCRESVPLPAELFYGLEIYPNPASSVLHISLPELRESADFLITDVLGKVFFQGQIQEQNFLTDVSGLQEGVYFISIISGNRKMNRKFIVFR